MRNKGQVESEKVESAERPNVLRECDMSFQSLRMLELRSEEKSLLIQLTMPEKQ